MQPTSRHPPGDSAAVRVVVSGQVQGVGFRPFVLRLATRHGLGGRVYNDPSGVCIEVEGRRIDLESFLLHIGTEAPSAASIDDLSTEAMTPRGSSTFTIDMSSPSAPPRVRVPRDLALCADCRRDIENRDDRRRGYPFTNCTACGPRYSILTGLPYDRDRTSMRIFPMCGVCRDEYREPTDRRFHAQPTACATCGPHVALQDRVGRNLASESAAIDAAAELLRRGEVLALKGLGGFQLLVRADSIAAVDLLRTRKRRPGKPFAVMVKDVAAASALTRMTPAEERLLVGPDNPIVLMDRRPDTGLLAPGTAPNVSTLGLFLPTTPLHHLLLSDLNLPVIATSGNLSEEPIVTEDREAFGRLGGVADAFLVHDRPIVRRLDDSVVGIIGGRPILHRAGRGYAPIPLRVLEKPAARRGIAPTLALGGHLKSAVALWTGTQAVLGEHIGDLDHPETRTALDEAVASLSRLFMFEADRLVCDKHPDYFTTRWAEKQDKPFLQVQHHHAHAVACMVEHDLLDREVLAFTWDGTGYGSDGTIWGGEVLRATVRDFERVASLLPFPLPGGEAAVHHPGRTAFGLLYVLLGENDLLARGDLLQRLALEPAQARLLAAMIRSGVHCPWTSSVGRLFDGLASLILGVRETTYEGEAAIRLETIAHPGTEGFYSMPMREGDLIGDWRPLLVEVLNDVQRDLDPGVMSARFHNALAEWAASVASMFPGLEIVLGGGCVQNRFLTERMTSVLSRAGRRVFRPEQIPPGDGGLAVGQLAVALYR